MPLNLAIAFLNLLPRATRRSKWLEFVWGSLKEQEKDQYNHSLVIGLSKLLWGSGNKSQDPKPLGSFSYVVSRQSCKELKDRNFTWTYFQLWCVMFAKLTVTKVQKAPLLCDHHSSHRDCNNSDFLLNASGLLCVWAGFIFQLSSYYISPSKVKTKTSFSCILFFLSTKCKTQVGHL